MIRTSTIALAIAAAVTACGKSSPPPQAPVVANATPVEATPYGGDAYGADAYGGDAYGGDAYGAWDESSDRAEGQYKMRPAAASVSLVGRWSGPCAGSKTAGFNRLMIDLTATEWDLRFETFADAACAKRKTSVHAGGTYVVQNQSSSAPTGWDTDFSFTRRDVTADDKKSAATLSKSCAGKVKVGVPFDILAKGCPSIGMKSVAECGGMFDVVEAQANGLRFGMRPGDGNLCTADRRPTQLAPETLTWRWTPSGIAECDALGVQYEKLMGCTSAEMTDEVKTQIREGIATASEQFSVAAGQTGDAKKAILDACKSGEQALAQAMPSMGC